MFFVCLLFFFAHNIQNNGGDKFKQQILLMVKIKITLEDQIDFVTQINFDFLLMPGS